MINNLSRNSDVFVVENDDGVVTILDLGSLTRKRGMKKILARASGSIQRDAPWSARPLSPEAGASGLEKRSLSGDDSKTTPFPEPQGRATRPERAHDLRTSRGT